MVFDKIREFNENRKKASISRLRRRLKEEAEMARLRETELDLKKSIAEKRKIAKSGSGFGDFGSKVVKGFRDTADYAAKTQAGKTFSKGEPMFGKKNKKVNYGRGLL